MILLKANKPTTITCMHNPDYDMEWDSDEFVFFVEMDKKRIKYLEDMKYRMHNLVPEILVYSEKFDFGCEYIARAEDFDEVEMF